MNNTGANIALWVSLFSLLIASISLGWNIYRDLLKPKLRVRFSLNFIFSEAGVEKESQLIISGTNFGPGCIILNGVILLRPWSRPKRIFGKAKFGFLFHDYKNPLSANFPCELDVGKRKDFFLVYDKGCFLKDDFVRIGILDSFGRYHWAPKRDYRTVKKEFERRFTKSPA